MKNFFKKIFILLSFILSLGLFNGTTIYAIDLGELDPNCKHEHVSGTFNQGFPCEYGDVEDNWYVFCEDCGGLIKEEKRVHKSEHGKRTKMVNGEEVCEYCGKPAYEDVRIRKEVITPNDFEEVNKEIKEREKREAMDKKIFNTIMITSAVGLVLIIAAAIFTKVKGNK